MRTLTAHQVADVLSLTRNLSTTSSRYTRVSAMVANLKGHLDPIPAPGRTKLYSESAVFAFRRKVNEGLVHITLKGEVTVLEKAQAA